MNLLLRLLRWLDGVPVASDVERALAEEQRQHRETARQRDWERDKRVSVLHQLVAERAKTSALEAENARLASLVALQTIQATEMQTAVAVFPSSRWGVA